MKNIIENNDQSTNNNDWDIFIKIKEEILFIILLRGYKKQILANTIYLIIAFVMLAFISSLIIPKEALITFLIIIRLVQVWVVYILKDFKIKERTEENKVRIKKNQEQMILIASIMACLWVMFSFVLPVFTIGNESISFIEISDKLNNLNLWLSNYLWGEYDIWQSIKDFMLYSILSAFSILIWYINRWKMLSLISLFGIFYYIIILFSIISNSDSIPNIINIMWKFEEYWLLNKDFSFSSASWLYVHLISFMYLIIPCFPIIKGYLDLNSEKVG
ncbi:MAG: hypothetical protein ACD_49C00083G0012 [uncultured bacterium (gcode 4)]|uniref:Uncharacterized protein n=1 Tax=uncultured bacterium (gcode 4) TaxID=1234023 RepID=K2ACU8_9BACT|nr:MAG: hypothetical protein ACD_49C00083G0012 [uncultured bacterium (gcode 4)]